MATDYNFIGGKGHRKVVKTIDIHEESYEAICKMVGSGMNSIAEPCGLFLEDAYKMFGGNCYGMTVSMAINCLLSDIVRNLEEKVLLTKKGEDVFCDLSETILPVMCCLNDEDGASMDELRFFNTDVEEIISDITPCLIDSVGKIFSNNLWEAVNNDNRPAGEIALGILMYLSSEVISTDKDAN